MTPEASLGSALQIMRDLTERFIGDQKAMTASAAAKGEMQIVHDLSARVLAAQRFEDQLSEFENAIQRGNDTSGVVDTRNAPSRAQAGEHPRKRRQKPTRIPDGRLTQESAFFVPILSVLEEAGGRMTAHDAIAAVGDRMSDVLSSDDLSPVASRSSDLRWRKTARRARGQLVKTGLVDGSIPRVWSITEAGRSWLRAQPHG